MSIVNSNGNSGTIIVSQENKDLAEEDLAEKENGVV